MSEIQNSHSATLGSQEKQNSHSVSFRRTCFSPWVGRLPRGSAAAARAWMAGSVPKQWTTSDMGSMPRMQCMLHNGGGDQAKKHIISLDLQQRPPTYCNSNGLQPTSNGLQHPPTYGNGLQPTSNGLQPNSNGLQPNGNGLQPNGKGLQPTSNI